MLPVLPVSVDAAQAAGPANAHGNPAVFDSIHDANIAWTAVLIRPLPVRSCSKTVPLFSHLEAYFLTSNYLASRLHFVDTPRNARLTDKLKPVRKVFHDEISQDT